MSDKQDKELWDLALDASKNFNFCKAIEYCNKIIKINENQDFTKLAREMKVSCYYSLNRYDDAIKTAKENLKIYNNVGCENSLENIGNCYYAKKEYQTALEYYSSALDICEKQENDKYSDVLGTLYEDCAKCYFELEQYPQAIKYMNKAKVQKTTIFAHKNKTSELKHTNLGRKIDF